MLSSKHESTCDILEKLQTELLTLKREREDLIAQLGKVGAGSHPSQELQVLFGHTLSTYKHKFFFE